MFWCARNETTLKIIHKQNIESTNFNAITVTFVAPSVTTPIIILHPKREETNSFEGVKKYLKKQRGWIDGVCITGGEPTLHSDLSSLFSKLREMGFLVKIDTNGTNPMMVKGLIGKELVDCIVMDIKAPCDWEKYS